MCEIDLDHVELEAQKAVSDGLKISDCPYPAGSTGENAWKYEFYRFRAQPAIAAGRSAAMQGLPADGYSDWEPDLQEAWRLGWKIEAEGPFPDLKNIEFTGRTDLLLD